jgi:hypothetical protein
MYNALRLYDFSDYIYPARLLYPECMGFTESLVKNKIMDIVIENIFLTTLVYSLPVREDVNYVVELEIHPDRANSCSYISFFARDVKRDVALWVHQHKIPINRRGTRSSKKNMIDSENARKEFETIVDKFVKFAESKEETLLEEFKKDMTNRCLT